MKNKTVVLIPVYQKRFTSSEIRSVENTIKIFGAASCCFIAPQTWERTFMKEIKGESGCRILYFEDDFFTGTQSYNRLLLSAGFYKEFSEYTFMLICQTDTFVFENRLEEWVEKNYDYLGAPWITGIHDNKPDFLPLGGNGGFSLRNIAACQKTLSVFKIMEPPSESMGYFKKFHSGIKLWMRFPLMILRILGYKNNSKHYTRNFGANEDVFWSTKAHTINKNFKPAPVSEEIAFAFEKYPSLLYEMNNKKLPFGCHAWEKYEPDFWKKFILQE